MTTHLEILQHALGVDQYGRGRHERNAFVTGPEGQDFVHCQELVACGHMKTLGAIAAFGGNHKFMVTPAGVSHVAQHSPQPPKLTRGQQRYQSYLDADCNETFGEWLVNGRENVQGMRHRG